MFVYADIGFGGLVAFFEPFPLKVSEYIIYENVVNPS